MSPTFQPSPPSFDAESLDPFNVRDNGFFYDFPVPDDLPDISGCFDDALNNPSPETEASSSWGCPFM